MENNGCGRHQRHVRRTASTWDRFGVAEYRPRARLTVDYIERSFDLYRRTRQRVKEHLNEVKKAGYDRVRLVGDGDVADICRLSCLEQDVEIVKDDRVPVLEVKGFKVHLQMENQE